MRSFMLSVLIMTSAGIAAQRPGAELPQSQRWSAIDSGKWSAIETRPLSERPAVDGLNQKQTEAALDRGNGRIIDPATYELRRLEFNRLASSAAAGGAGPRIEFHNLQDALDYQRQLDRAAMQQATEARRAQVVETESQRLAAERERLMQFLAKPRHAEAAIVEKQTEKK
jgi:hypothetical protein